ncbi:MAG: ABC transporter ATP-binding protein [Acidimicrobiales bacterium]
MLELDVSVERRDLVVEVALAVAPGERVALYGPSGAGKTTLLETVAGLAWPVTGAVTLNGRTLTATLPRPVRVPVWQRRTGLLRQQIGLFPHLSVAENLGYARRGREGSGARDALAARLGVTPLLAERPGTLSGGQCQRVALCRLLLDDVEALLLDEPYTGLDAELRRTVTDTISDAATRRGLPAVLVAHELTEAQAFADRLGVVDRGRLLQIGEPHQIVRRPASRRVAEIVGYRCFVPLEGGSTVVGVHPARVAAGAHHGAGVVLSGTVVDRRAAGARWEVDVEVAGVRVTCELDDLPPGATTAVTVLDPPLFASDGSAVR